MSDEIEARPSLRLFAEQMEAQLKANDHRGGWDDCKPGYLHQRIQANLIDLGTHRAGRDWKSYRRTCVDVGNFAMMLFDNSFHNQSQVSGLSPVAEVPGTNPCPPLPKAIPTPEPWKVCGEEKQ